MSDYEAIVEKTLVFYQTKRENLTNNNTAILNKNRPAAPNTKSPTPKSAATVVISLLEDVTPESVPKEDRDEKQQQHSSKNEKNNTRSDSSSAKSSPVIHNSAPLEKRQYSPLLSPVTPSLQRNPSSFDADILGMLVL
jgi:hypothetical protein